MRKLKLWYLKILFGMLQNSKQNTKRIQKRYAKAMADLREDELLTHGQEIQMLR